MAKTTDKKTNTEHVESKCVDLSQAELNELFANGKAHYDKGEYDEAEKYWRQAAEAGDANAKVALAWVEAKKPKEFVIEDGVLVKYNGDGGDVKIPDGVTSIGKKAFYNCSSLTRITIPDSVTSIGNSVFCNCSGLTGITIPNSVTSIGNSAFYGCSGLTSITIPNSVTSIGNSVFHGCSGLSSITIPNGVTSIGNSVVGCCPNIENLSVSSGNEKYHSICNCIIETATKKQIAGCKNSVIPPDGSVTIIGYGAFYGCSSLTSVNIPNCVAGIGDYAFCGCTGLTSIEITSSVTSIYRWAFASCSGLTSVKIPSGVEIIRDNTFYNCTGLTSIEIPSSVTSIEYEAFDACGKLAEIKFDGTKRQWRTVKKDRNKGSEWDRRTGEYVVVCTNGTIKK